MTAAFLKILNMGITASWLILAVFLLRFALRKTPKWITCILWALVAVRLICPFTIESALSLTPHHTPLSETNITAPSHPTERTLRVHHPSINDDPSENYFVDENSENENLEVATNLRSDIEKDILPLLSIIWIIGIAIMIIYILVSYLKLCQNTRASMPLYENVVICDNIDVPFVFGMVRPRIYLPSDLEDDQAEYVIAHEKAHIARLDHWWKLIGFFILSIYWFHPLCWISYQLLCQDLETACDEHVVKSFSVDDKKRYAKALLAYSIKQKTITACSLSFGEIGTEKRIRNILYYKKPALWVILVSMTVCIVMAVCFLTDPAEESPANTNTTDMLADTGSKLSKNQNPVQLTESNDDEVDVVQRFMNVNWDEVKQLSFIGPAFAATNNIVCIGELPEHDIKVYGYNDDEIKCYGVAVDIKGDVNYFDWSYTGSTGILPNLYWDEKHNQLQITFHIYTGTGASADNLYVLQRYDTGTLAPYNFDFDGYRAELKKQISYTFHEESNVLTLIDRNTKKELASTELPEGNVTGIELGMISKFQLGDNITYQVTPGYLVDGGAMAQYDHMPTLEFNVTMNMDENDDISFHFNNPRKQAPVMDSQVESMRATSLDSEEYTPDHMWAKKFGLDNDFAHKMQCGFLVAATDRTVEVDLAEYIEIGDTERIKELGLAELTDMPDGYYFHDPDTDTVVWKLDSDTQYLFIDWDRNFVQDPDDLFILTKDREMFRAYLETYTNGMPKMPFFFYVENGVVRLMVEKPFA